MAEVTRLSQERVILMAQLEFASRTIQAIRP